MKTLAAAFLLALSASQVAPILLRRLQPPSPVRRSFRQLINTDLRRRFVRKKISTRHQIAKARMCLTQKDSASRG